MVGRVESLNIQPPDSFSPLTTGYPSSPHILSLGLLLRRISIYCNFEAHSLFVLLLLYVLIDRYRLEQEIYTAEYLSRSVAVINALDSTTRDLSLASFC